MLIEINAKIRNANKQLIAFGRQSIDVSVKEFYDWMTGEIFSPDTTTLYDVLGNEYIMMHELVEIGEVKKTGRIISKRVIVDSPKIVIYDAHLTAMETELEYALRKGDTFWMKIRLKQHKEGVLEDDPNLPEELRSRAERIYQKYAELAQRTSERVVTL